MRANSVFRFRGVVLGGVIVFMGCATAGPLSSSKNSDVVYYDGEQIPSETFYTGNGGINYVNGSPATLFLTGDKGEKQSVFLMDSTTMVEGSCFFAKGQGSTSSTRLYPGYFEMRANRDMTLLKAIELGGGQVCGKIVLHEGKWVATAVEFVLSPEQTVAMSKVRQEAVAKQQERQKELQEHEVQAEAAKQREIEAWRTLRKKPPLPEEARKNRVLAENAVKEKRFEDAARYYEAGLKVEKMWPEAHYNAAILYGELNNYARAVEHLHWYLDLVPNAPDAQAARDKLIIWEEKAPKKANGVATTGKRK